MEIFPAHWGARQKKQALAVVVGLLLLALVVLPGRSDYYATVEQARELKLARVDFFGPEPAARQLLLDKWDAADELRAMRWNPRTAVWALIDGSAKHHVSILESSARDSWRRMDNWHGYAPYPR